MTTDAEFLAQAIGGLSTERLRLLVSEWAEQKRYLPPELTPRPGMWDNSYAPYLTEIMDTLSAGHPARKVVVMKGAQVGLTTGVLENFIGYTIDHDPCGMLYMSADQQLAKMGIELKVDRMIHHSGLASKIFAPAGKTKRSGDTAKFKEFASGFLMAVGARSPGKMRSVSVRKAVLDEVDGMPLVVGGIGQEEGGPIEKVEKRTDNYESTRKLLYISTPLKMQTSQIYPLFMRGDQRYHHIPCIHCGHMQELEWHGVTEGGKHYGITFDLDDNDILVTDSVGYVCRNCFAIFWNHDKPWFLPKGKWIPRAQSQEEGLVSFHLASFYSPPGMYSWKGSVYKWLKAWNVRGDHVRDIDKLQDFYNLERGLPWEERGQSPKFERVIAHRRAVYSEGEVPNAAAVKETGAPVVLLTSAVDIHKRRLDVEVLGWCQDRQTYSINWLHLEGDTTDLYSQTSPWQKLRTLLEHQWVADDGRVYSIQLTLIDVGWAERLDEAYQFCGEYSSGVAPVMGREKSMRGAAVKEFSETKSATGNQLFNVTAALYKDRISSWLNMDWLQGELQPTGYPNYPQDRHDDFFRQYEAEEKVAKLDPVTKQNRGWLWRQIGQRDNHAFDCRVYNMAALDMIVLDVCQQTLGLEQLSYPEFFNYATPKENSDGKWFRNEFSHHQNELR